MHGSTEPAHSTVTKTGTTTVALAADGAVVMAIEGRVSAGERL